MGIDIQWPLVLFTLVAGIGAGILVPVAVDRFAEKRNERAQFAAAITSLVLLAVGGCFSLLHLASPENVMAAVFNIFSFSGISLELILLGLCFVVAAVFAILLKRQAPPAALKIVAVLAAVFAVLLMFFCGHGYVMPSRPAWDTNTLPLAYLGTSLMGGAFAYGLVRALFKEEGCDYKAFKMTVLVCGIVCAATCIAYSISVVGSASECSPVAFWGGVVLIGIVLALVMGALAYLKLDAANALMFCAMGVVVSVLAILAVRIVMWDTSAGYLELFELASIAAPVIP